MTISPVLALARALLPLLAAAATASPADAAVAPIQAGADSQTQVGIGAPDTVRFGPSDRTSNVVADPYVVSKSDSRDDRGLSQAVGSAGSAVQFNGPNKADFFVRSSANANAVDGDFQYPAHAAASGSAFYDFSVDTESALSFTFSAFASAAPAANAYVALNLFSYGTHTYLQQGLVAGADALSYTVPVGSYGVTITAFSEGTIPANIPINTVANSGATANLSLAVSAVPEPASWMLMLLAIGAVGAVQRGRWSTAPTAAALQRPPTKG